MNYVMHLSSVVRKECLERKPNGKNVGIVIENVLEYNLVQELIGKKKNTSLTVLCFLKGVFISWNLCDLTNGQIQECDSCW